MDEDLSIINANTRNEKIKNFFVNNKKLLISSVIILVLITLAITTLALYAAAFFTFGATLPAAIAGTLFFISISVPLAIVIAQIGSKLNIKPSKSIPDVPSR